MPPAPKANPVRRNLRSTKATIQAAGAVKPKLPDLGVDEMSGVARKRNPMTLVWWDTIWSSPISDEWVDADVPGLLALAQLVDDFWTAKPEDRAKRHAEVRMASQQFGLSPFSRRQLQWEVRKLEGRSAPAAPRARTKGGRAVLSVLDGSA